MDAIPNQGRAQIDYPCDWLYKVIGKDAHEIRDILSRILQGKKYKTSFSNISGKGNYLSFNVEVWVENQQQRDDIYQRLRTHAAIKAVL